MGKRLHFLFPAIFLAVICMSGKANAQAFELYTIQEDMFPTVEAFIYAEDPSGAPISGAAFKVEDFNVSENGTPVTAASPYNLRVECVENEYQSPVNVVFALDISTSMDEDAGNGETRYDWVKYAMSEFLDSLKLQPPGGVCIMPFAGNTRDNSGFQTDRDILNQFLKDLPTADGLTKFDRAFMNVPPQQKPGAIWLLEQRPADIRRVIIFLTDGRHESQIPFDENPVWAKCKDEGIEVYSITIGLSMEPDLREISQETGGKEYAIWDKDVLVSTMWDIVGRIQKQDICKLVWEAPLACEGDNLDRNVEITYNPLTLSDASTYTVPPSGVTELLISETKLLFGAPGVGTNQRTFDLTSTKGTIAIESMSIVPSAADFTVEPAPPFNVIEGTPTTVTVTYTADPAGDPGEYTLSYSGTPCSPEPLTLIAPCGGQYTEQFDFGQVANNTVKPHTLTEVFVNNTPEIIVGDAQLSGADAAMFNLKSGGGPFTLSPSQALTVEVEFSPTSLGAKSAQIDYNIANGAVCGSPSTLLSGESISTDFPITDYSFGMIRVNHTENYTYNLTNNTQAPANITKIELIDNADGNFALGNDPTGLIDPAQSVDLIINYTPKDAGPHECILQITVEDLSAPVEATISGIGGLPVLDVETELQFGQYKLGETSNEMTLTLTNTGNMDLHIESVSDISGEFIFVGSPNLTDITIPANNGQESFELTFTPTQAGQRTDVIEISHDAVEGPEPVTYQTSTVDLIGYGLSLEINPKSIDFEEVLTCNTAQEVVTIPNSGTEDTDVTVSIDGAGATAFSVDKTSFSIPAGEEGSFTVTFSPQLPQIYLADINVETDLGTAVIPVTGTGTITSADVKITNDKLKFEVGKIANINFDITIPDLQGKLIDEMTLIFEFENARAFKYESFIADDAFTGWSWNENIEAHRVTLTGTGAGINSDQTFSNTFRAMIYLSEKNKTDFSVTLEMPDDINCLTPDSDASTIDVNTCFSFGNLVNINYEGFDLSEIKPNPVNLPVEVDYSVAFDVHTNLKLFNSIGEEVWVFSNNTKKAGKHNITIPVNELGSGIYFLRMHAGPFTQTRKLIITK